MPTDAHIAHIRSRNGKGKQPSTSATRTVTLLVLLADTPIETVRNKLGYKSYHDVFCSLFQRSLDTIDDSSVELVVKSYDVVNEPWEYPTEQELATAAGVLITGSAASAYEDIPWINRLVDFTSQIPGKYPHLKLIGICYGHQIIARAFGGKVEKNTKGWELGVRTVELTQLGKKLLKGTTDATNTIDIHQVHQDHVPALPSEKFGLLGSTPVCAIQGMVSPPDPASLQDIKIFTLQGHPEFSPELVLEIIDAREAKGILTKEFAAQSRDDARLHDEGVPLGAVILTIVGI